MAANDCKDQWPYSWMPGDTSALCEVYGKKPTSATFYKALVQAGLEQNVKPSSSVVVAVAQKIDAYYTLVGLDETQACVLKAWLGGAPDYDSMSLGDQFSHDAGLTLPTAQDTCGVVFIGLGRSIASVLDDVKAYDPQAAALLESAGKAAAAVAKKNEERNVKEDVAKLKSQALPVLGGAGLVLVAVLALVVLAETR